MTRKSIHLVCWFWAVVLGLGVGTAFAAEGSLADKIAALVASAGNMKMGVRVELISDRPIVIYEHNADEPLTPASNQKLISSAAAMCLLSPEFTYRTVLAVRGEDLIIIGAGDPSCGDSELASAGGGPITAMFHRWAERLKAAGHTNIRGDLLFDDSVFDETFTPESWRKFNALSPDCAPTGGLNFNLNCISVLVKPGAGGVGSTPEITLVPGTSWVTLQNTAKTAKSGDPLVRRTGSGPLTVVVSGSVARPNSMSSPLRVTVTDPGMFFATACRTSLAAQGITIHGDTRRARVRQASGALPPELQTVDVHETKLLDVMWRANKCSINMYAEVMLKTVGAYAGRESAPGVGGYETGRAATEKFLTELGVPKADYRIDDGSGRSLNDRASAAMLTAVLRRMNAHPQRRAWWESLATPGDSDGTLRRRMKDISGRVFAKTGHIEGVSSLSGYVVGRQRQVYVFSILCNEKARAKVAPNDFQDNICRAIANWGPPAEKEAKGG